MTQLYKLSEHHQQLQRLVEQDEIPLEQLQDTFELVEEEFNDKAVALVYVANNVSSDVAEIDSEIKRLQDRKRIFENKQKQLCEYLRSNMEAAGITTIESPLFSITLAAGRDIAVIDDESSLPENLVAVKTTSTPDKREILAALKTGLDVPGAHLEKSKTSLRIK